MFRFKKGVLIIITGKWFDKEEELTPIIIKLMS